VSLSQLHPHHTDYHAFLTECATESNLSPDEVHQLDQLHDKIEGAKEMGLTRREIVVGICIGEEPGEQGCQSDFHLRWGGGGVPYEKPQIPATLPIIKFYLFH
jgi:hypothetical protein